MCLNRTSEWKFMTIGISRELPLFIFERVDILCAWIGPASEKLWPFEFLESIHCSISIVSIYFVPKLDLRVKSYDHLNCPTASIVKFSSVSIYYAHVSDLWVKSYDHLNFSRASDDQFRASQYIMRLNRTSEWKVITIWISQELPLFNFERLDILCAWMGSPSEKLWPFEFLETFRCSISSVSIYYAPESDLRGKSYDHLKFSRASVVQFRASRYITHMNRTSEWKVMTI